MSPEDALLQAVLDWQRAKFWADANPHLMLSSQRTTDEAAAVMTNYFDKERALIDAAEAYRVSRETA